MLGASTTHNHQRQKPQECKTALASMDGCNSLLLEKASIMIVYHAWCN